MVKISYNCLTLFCLKCFIYLQSLQSFLETWKLLLKFSEYWELFWAKFYSHDVIKPVIGFESNEMMSHVQDDKQK